MSEFESVEVLVRSAFATMPPISKQIFLLHATGKCDIPTIAVMLGMCTDGVERHLTEALIHLDQALSSHVEHIRHP
jgi:DNA-directed RNA polymerase specialized sigma24 family protein